MRTIKKYFIIASCLLIVSGGLYLLSYKAEFYNMTKLAGFNVQEIDLYGRENTTIDSVANIVDMDRGSAILAIDIQSMQQRLRKLAWVKDASVQRVLPDKLEIEISEHQPIAVWKNKESYYIISDEGKILTVDTKNFKDLPIVIGNNAPIGTPLLLSYVDSHFPEIKHRIKSIIKEGDRRWSLVLDDLQNGIEIKLPEASPNVALEELASIQEKSQLLNQNLAAIDLRIPDKIMIKFQDVSSNKSRRQDS